MPEHLLIIGFVWPEPKSSAAGSRMLQLIEAFKKQGYKITFASPCTKTDNAFNLKNIDVYTASIELNSESFDVFVKNLNPSIVLFDRFMMEEQFGWRVTEQCPKALKILDTEDLHGLRKGRQQAFKADKPFDKTYLFNEVAKREIASIYRCDLSLIISEIEMTILKKSFNVDESLLCYVPFMLDPITEDSIKLLQKLETRHCFITIGNFLHEPNYNAVLYLKETIWPLIKKQLPKAELHVYGAYASQKVNQLHNKKQGFFIKGFAESVNQVMQTAKVCLAPIRFGAGLKGKLIDAMRYGTPSVTTVVGAEGMYGDFELNGFIEEEPDVFATKAVMLFENEDLWNMKQENGFNIINKRFNKNEHQENLLKKVETLKEGLINHRLKNFTGQMLQYQSMQSTKYMSKWIEEKNKKA